MQDNLDDDKRVELKKRGHQKKKEKCDNLDHNEKEQLRKLKKKGKKVMLDDEKKKKFQKRGV